MGYTSGMKCYIQPCTETEVIEEHHIIPQSRGGSNLWTINLCANHHDKAHRLAISKTKLEEIVNPKLRKVVKVIRLANSVLPHSDTWNVTVPIPTILNKRIGADAKQLGVSKQKIILNILIKHYIAKR